MSDVRIVALHQDERRAVLKILEHALAGNETDDPEMLQGVAEMILNARRADEFGGLNDA